jgi:hypothetical protein
VSREIVSYYEVGSKLWAVLWLAFQPLLISSSYAQDSLSNSIVDENISRIKQDANIPLTLFEGIEVSESRPDAPNRPTRESRATSSGPVFTLIGTSRIGNKRSAIVRHQNGESIRVSTNLGGTTPIVGYEEYSIFDVGAGNLSVRYPSNVPCIAHKDQGVSCLSSPNTAQLQLVNAEALARVEPAPSIPLSADGSSGLVDGATGVSLEGTANPFEALRAARAAGGNPAEISPGDGRNGRFTPRRISPEDVPRGMRVVSTPFGDRLVEQ